MEIDVADSTSKNFFDSNRELMLGNLSNVRRTINAQGMTETYTNVIPSYCMLRLTYKFGKKARKT